MIYPARFMLLAACISATLMTACRSNDWPSAATDWDDPPLQATPILPRTDAVDTAPLSPAEVADNQGLMHDARHLYLRAERKFEAGNLDHSASLYVAASNRLQEISDDNPLVQRRQALIAAKLSRIPLQ